MIKRVNRKSTREFTWVRPFEPVKEQRQNALDIVHLPLKVSRHETSACHHLRVFPWAWFMSQRTLSWGAKWKGRGPCLGHVVREQQRGRVVEPSCGQNRKLPTHFRFLRPVNRSSNPAGRQAQPRTSKYVAFVCQIFYCPWSISLQGCTAIFMIGLL